MRAIRPKTAVSRRLGLILALAGLVLLPDVLGHGPVLPKEHHVKAAFLYNFAKYVEWPAGRRAGEFRIAAFCAAPFVAALEQVVTGRTVHGRPMRVLHLHTAAEARDAQMVYVCAEYAAQWPAIRAVIADAPTLTVADSPRAEPAVLQFVLEGDKVRFRVDMLEAHRAGLVISDQLQKLAVAVRRSP